VNGQDYRVVRERGRRRAMIEFSSRLKLCFDEEIAERWMRRIGSGCRQTLLQRNSSIRFRAYASSDL
jgi:hypothetical protein